MGNTAVSSLIERASIVIQDELHVRWPEEELLKWLNDGQREIVLHKPSAYPQEEVKNLDSGTRQSIPSGGVSLIDIPRNEVGNYAPVRIVEKEIIDTQMWHNASPQQEVYNYTFDPRNPKVFYVSPPNDGTGKLRVVYSAAPVDVSLSDTISIDDIYANALLDYIIYRAASKDADYAVNAQRAEAMYQIFLNSLGVLDARHKTMEPNINTKQNISQRYISG